jgi:hypothetical protein
MNGDDGLEVEIEEGLVLEGATRVEIELERDRDDVADGILRLFGEIGDVVFGVGRLGSTGLRRWRVLAQNEAGREQQKNAKGGLRGSHGCSSREGTKFPVRLLYAMRV